MTERPGKNSMGYACPRCEEERKKDRPYQPPERRPALYERDSKGFHYAGYINCPRHGIETGQALSGTRTLFDLNHAKHDARAQIHTPDPAAGDRSHEKEHVKLKTISVGPQQGKSEKLLRYAASIDGNAQVITSEDIKAMTSAAKPAQVQKPILSPQLSRKSLASMAAQEHKLAKAASSRIYHAVQIDDQVLYKGSTGAIYKWAILGKQPDGAWRFYAGAEDHIQAGGESAKLRARSDKQKLDMEIRIIAAVSEKEA